MSVFSVVPLLRVVANGRAKDGTLRLTVIATPYQSTGSDSFDIRNWPVEMARRLANGEAPFKNGALQLSVRQASPVGEWAATEAKPSNPDAFKAGWADVQSLWPQALKGTDKDWEDLVADLTASTRRQKVKADAKGSPKLDAAFTGKKDLALDGSISVEPPKSTDPLLIASVIPIRQCDLAMEEETVRAARVLAKQYAGPFAVLDDRGAEETEVDTPQNRFNAVIAATENERAYAAATFVAIDESINTGQEFKPADASGLTPRPELVPPVQHVVAPHVISPDGKKADEDRAARRATQEYGVWLQRRTEYTAKEFDKAGKLIPPQPADETELAPASDASLQRMRGVFSALQGDPILSRLFCLAFDFQVVGAFPLNGDVHLAVGPREPDGGAVQVATAARKHEGGFWPVSVFDAKANPQPAFVDQKDGFWKLDGKSALGPRYEIGSLDVRRSVDSKTLGRDRGEAHQTAGLTILDRGRSEQIARDLALAEFDRRQLGADGDESALVVLHAEELTIGRRVDVGVAQSNGIAWRSLMRRYVDFTFGKDDEKIEAVLRGLIEDFRENKNKGVLEETSFQVAARLIPTRVNGFEAVAEEAIFLWDGTPASVLTDRANRDSVQSALPFDSHLDLPGSAPNERIHRPPPLRFGVPYAFRLRSSFLGGGSPAFDVESGSGAAPDTIVGPRRFLRHDSIAAPILLLPQHLAAQRLGHMGYEAVDQAIVRSWDNAPANLDALHQTEKVKGDYIGAEQRTQPAETLRVFVPPEAPLDLVTRHGKLDSRDTAVVANIRRGGLRDVNYTPRRNNEQATSGANLVGEDGRPIPKPSGFPLAISTRLDALDGEGVIYPRTTVPVEAATERGVPVFEPGGLNKTGSDEVGYLPDPAIDHYCVRAKFRDSDIYLSGGRSVALYRGTSFPNALPLVIKVSRENFVRAVPPTKIETICGEATVTTIDAKGKIPASATSRTTVQLLHFRLCQGEDFSLEVSCLPTAAELEARFSVPETVAMQLYFAAGEAPENKAAKQRLVDICGDPVAKACVKAESDGTKGRWGYLVPGKAGRKAVADALIAAMETQWPVEEIAAVSTLRICHALNKPSLDAINWVSTAETLRTVRPKGATSVIEGPPPSEENATELAFEGELDVDLDLVESFHIMARAVAADGFDIDSAERGRSTISKRSGRWPVFIRDDGCEAYVPPNSVVGFVVNQNGKVELPREPVTLLSVGNLPTTRSIGPDVPLNEYDIAEGKSKLRVRPKQMAGKPGLVFKELNGRRTKVALWPLFAAAIAKSPLEQWIALPANGVDKTNRTRRLQIQRPHVFADTLARKLMLDLVVVSRGAAAFETAPTYRKGLEQALVRRQPLKREDQAVRGPATPLEIWMKSTKAPAAPDVRRPEPAFVFTRKFDGGPKAKPPYVTNGTHTVTREAKTRLYLGRGWYSSGEGERLGIVLWPPDYHLLAKTKLDEHEVPFGGRRMLLNNFDDRDIGAAGAYGTRWGGDPIREDVSVQHGFFIQPWAFRDVPELRDSEPKTAATKPLGKSDAQSKPIDVASVRPNPHEPAYEPRALIPIPRASPTVATDASAEPPPPEARDYLPVSLVTYQPCFDLDREEWYVDVDLMPTRASEPFVRFGLVRYQKQSISDELMASEPVSVQMQLLPMRTVELRVTPHPTTASASEVNVTVRGRGSVGIKPLSIDSLPSQYKPNSEKWIAEKQKMRDNFALLNTPKIRASVFHESGSANARVRVPLALPDWALALGQEASALPLEIPYRDRDGDELIWHKSFTLPETMVKGLGEGQIVLYLEEVDLRMPASYREEPVTLEKMFDRKTFVTSGPRFSARVPFHEAS